MCQNLISNALKYTRTWMDSIRQSPHGRQEGVHKLLRAQRTVRRGGLRRRESEDADRPLASEAPHDLKSMDVPEPVIWERLRSEPLIVP